MQITHHVSRMTFFISLALTAAAITVGIITFGVVAFVTMFVACSLPLGQSQPSSPAGLMLFGLLFGSPVIGILVACQILWRTWPKRGLPPSGT